MLPGPQLSVGLDSAELRPSEVVSGFVTAPFRLDGFTSARVDIGYRTSELVDTSVLGNSWLGIVFDLFSVFDGNTSSSMKLQQRWVAVAGAELRLDELNSGRATFRVAVPAGVPATADRVASWLVWARALRGDGYELGGAASLRILRTAEPHDELAVTNHDGAGNLDLVLQSVSARPGEALRGSVRLTLPKQLQVKRISARLGADQISTARRLPTRYASLGNVEAVLASDEAVAAGWREWPFELRVPADAEPSSRAEKAWQRWWVTAEVDYRGIRNKTNVARREVIVYNAP